MIPKELREQLGLEQDVEFSLDVEGASLRLTPVRRAGRQIIEIDGWPVLAAPDQLRTTDVDVQRWRDADQR